MSHRLQLAATIIVVLLEKYERNRFFQNVCCWMQSSILFLYGRHCDIDCKSFYYVSFVILFSNINHNSTWPSAPKLASDAGGQKSAAESNNSIKVHVRIVDKIDTEPFLMSLSSCSPVSNEPKNQLLQRFVFNRVIYFSRFHMSV